MKKSSIRKTWNVISSILVALVVLLALLLVGARLFGLQVYTVLSGSMEPTYHTGSLIYVKKVDPYTIRDGQVITFMLDENTIATHRVVGVVPDEEDSTVVRFRTKGDANETEDGGLVHYKNVIGTPVFTIPYLGFVANYIQHPPGMYVAISAGAVLLMLTFLPDIFAKGKSAKLEAVLTVPAELGNEYAYRVGEVDWVFTVEGFNNEKPLIPTGQLNWPVAVFGALGVLLIAGGVVVLTKKKKHDEA